MPPTTNPLHLAILRGLQAYRELHGDLDPQRWQLDVDGGTLTLHDYMAPTPDTAILTAVSDVLKVAYPTGSMMAYSTSVDATGQLVMVSLADPNFTVRMTPDYLIFLLFWNNQ